MGYRCVIAAISKEDGFIYYELMNHAVNTKIYLSYVKDLSEEMGGKPFAMYMDNLTLHKTVKAKKLYEKLNILPIYSITYMPQFNPIEYCFSQVKRVFNKNRLWALANDVPFDMEDQISDAFDVITP